MTAVPWEAYAQTVIEIDLGSRRLVVAPVAAGAPLSWPDDLMPPLHVITAWNPGSIPLAPERNEARQRRLETQLAGLVDRRLPALGRSPDGRWSEVSAAVTGLDRTIAAAIGHGAGQAAVFELDDTIRVVRCIDARVVSDRPGVVESTSNTPGQPGR